MVAMHIELGDGPHALHRDDIKLDDGLHALRCRPKPALEYRTRLGRQDRTLLTAGTHPFHREWRRYGVLKLLSEKFQAIYIDNCNMGCTQKEPHLSN